MAKKTWKNINTILGNKNKQEPLGPLKSDIGIIDNTVQMAETLKVYFTKVARMSFPVK